MLLQTPAYLHESSLLAIFYRLRLYLVHLLESVSTTKSTTQTKQVELKAVFLEVVVFV